MRLRHSAQCLSSAPRQSHAAQITKHYLPLERDPLISPEQRAVRVIPQRFSATFCPRFFPFACRCRTFASVTRCQIFMTEWWNKTHALMVSSGATRASLQHRLPRPPPPSCSARFQTESLCSVALTPAPASTPSASSCARASHHLCTCVSALLACCLRPTITRRQLMASNRIPVLVFSAGLADVVECFLASEGALPRWRVCRARV